MLRAALSIFQAASIVPEATSIQQGRGGGEDGLEGWGKVRGPLTKQELLCRWVPMCVIGSGVSRNGMASCVM